MGNYDGTLQVLIGAVDTSYGLAEIDLTVTLLVSGQELTGRVISEEAYYREMAATGHDQLGIVRTAFGPLAEEARKKREENRDRMQRRHEVPLPPPPKMPEYLHLQVESAEGETKLWRLDLASIDAWTLDDLAVGPPLEEL